MTAAILFVCTFILGFLLLKLIDFIAYQISLRINNYPFNAEWDTQVYNWLLEDDLKVTWEKPYLTNFIHTIECPLGKVWISNYPYAFGHKYEKGPQYSLSYKTKLKFKQRLEELGLTFDPRNDSFKDENV